MFLNLKSVWRFFPAVDGNILFVFKFSGGPIFYLGFSGGAAISLTFDCFLFWHEIRGFFFGTLSAFSNFFFSESVWKNTLEFSADFFPLFLCWNLCGPTLCFGFTMEAVMSLTLAWFSILTRVQENISLHCLTFYIYIYMCIYIMLTLASTIWSWI